MPITTHHPEYDAALPAWQKCRDFVQGEDQVKSKGGKYLPKLNKQTSERYDTYKKRAYFYNAVGRTSAALTGGMLRKLPLVKLPEKLSYLYEDATGTGLSIYELIARITKEQLDVGRCGLLVDLPTAGGMPYLAMYSAEDVTNWGKDFFVIHQTLLEDDPEDRFEKNAVEAYRELRLEDGAYIVVEHRENGKDYDETVYEPVKFGRRLGYIPFTIISPTGLDNDVDKPPIKDLVDIQAHHYLVSADLAWANHLIALPVPIAIGNFDDDFVIELGSSVGLKLPEGSQFQWSEFTGQGLKSIHDTAAKLEAQMAALGARLLDTRNKTIIETATSAIAKEASVTSVTSQTILSTQLGIERALRWAADWVGADPDEVEIKINYDMLPSNFDANMLNSMLQGVQSGIISFETFYRNLENAGLSEPGVEPAEEIKRIAKTMEMLSENVEKPEPLTNLQDPETDAN